MSANRDLPRTLPVDAKGFTRRMIIHMNFGEDGGAAKYSIHGPDDIDMPIAYQYDTRKDSAQKGFYLHGVERIFTWPDLVAYWPEFIAGYDVANNADEVAP